MSEQETAEQTAPQENTKESSSSSELKLDGIYVFKMAMMTIAGEDGSMIPVTALKYDPMYVSQVKTKEKDGYEAVQVAFKPKPARTACKAEIVKFKKAGFENSAYFSREIRQALPQGVAVGQKVSLLSLEKGTLVKAVAKSKGRGFSGVMKRYNFAGGPGAHGSKFHRKPGSVGMRTWPGRVLKGKRLPGQYGNKQTTIRKLTIVDVIPQENVILVKGAIPGAMNSLVKLVRE